MDEAATSSAAPGQDDAAAASEFGVKDCALIAVATGRRAQNLRELRDILSNIDEGSIYYHFWGSRLQSRFDNPEFQNDFASWAQVALQDGIMAERLGVIDPTDFESLEELRQELIDVIEERLDESDHVTWTKVDQQFNFLTSQIVVFDTHKVIHHPRELATVLPTMTLGSIFYHVIDARRRTVNSVDDFRSWLFGYGSPFGDKYVKLAEELRNIDPFFSTLADLRDELTGIFELYFGGGA